MLCNCSSGPPDSDTWNNLQIVNLCPTIKHLNLRSYIKPHMASLGWWWNNKTSDNHIIHSKRESIYHFNKIKNTQKWRWQKQIVEQSEELKYCKSIVDTSVLNQLKLRTSWVLWFHYVILVKSLKGHSEKYNYTFIYLIIWTIHITGRIQNTRFY